ncbi:hypothetical protein QJS10_CPB04g01521 [Acorus calamus]|uniref:Uncharacterized protein n=1 Tax=Acorus calamus TaxID=4465 RepID=A0AAV9F577_ACOCL|nr:hypothetical protein QJS10_CPB04g01521 [Acorus calamus]
MSKRHLLKQGIWSAKITHSGSWIWPKILASRGWIKQHVRYILFTGGNVSAWDDPWINGASLVDLFPATSIHREVVKSMTYTLECPSLGQPVTQFGLGSVWMDDQQAFAV